MRRQRRSHLKIDVALGDGDGVFQRRFVPFLRSAVGQHDPAVVVQPNSIVTLETTKFSFISLPNDNENEMNQSRKGLYRSGASRPALRGRFEPKNCSPRPVPADAEASMGLVLRPDRPRRQLPWLDLLARRSNRPRSPRRRRHL